MKQYRNLIYYNNIVINMRQCITVEMFEDNTIVLMMSNDKTIILRDLDNCELCHKQLIKALKY